jgi:hypothetical protein
MARLVIKNHRPWQMAVAIIALSSVLSLMTWLLLDNNHWQVIRSQLSKNSSTEDLIEENQVLVAENSELNGRILMLEQTTRLDQETAVQMQQDLKTLQDDIYGLKRELEFYKGVMDTSKRVSGFDIHGTFVVPLSKPNHYQMKIVLTNVDRSDRILEGNLDIRVDGMLNNGKRTLNLSNIIVDEITDLSFELKNFKQIEVNFQLPAEYVPEKIRVVASINKTNLPLITRAFDWSTSYNF